MESYNISLYNKSRNYENLPNTESFLTLESLIRMKKCSGIYADEFVRSVLEKIEMYHTNLITKSRVVEVYFWLFNIENKEFIIIKEYENSYYHLYPVGYQLKTFNCHKIKLSKNLMDKSKLVLNLDKLKSLNEVKYRMKNIDLLLEISEKIEKKLDEDLGNFLYHIVNYDKEKKSDYNV